MDRPYVLAPLEEGIPEQLKALRRWVLWRHDLRNGEYAKVPYHASGARPARSNDPSTWSDFAPAWQRYCEGGFDGVGFVLAAADGHFGIDLDDVVANGELDPLARSVLVGLGSYAETSPSGKGVKCLLRAAKRDARCRVGHAEVYSSCRYFCLTGRRLSFTPPDVRPRQHALDLLYERNWGAPPPPEPVRRTSRAIAHLDDVERRAAAYAARCEPAVSGANGHGRTFSVARAICHGFALGRRGFDVLWRHYNPRCRPPWSERELLHKVEDATERPSSRPYGWLL